MEQTPGTIPVPQVQDPGRPWLMKTQDPAGKAWFVVHLFIPIINRPTYTGPFSSEEKAARFYARAKWLLQWHVERAVENFESVMNGYPSLIEHGEWPEGLFDGSLRDEQEG